MQAGQNGFNQLMERSCQVTGHSGDSLALDASDDHMIPIKSSKNWATDHKAGLVTELEWGRLEERWLRSSWGSFERLADEGWTLLCSRVSNHIKSEGRWRFSAKGEQRGRTRLVF